METRLLTYERSFIEIENFRLWLCNASETKWSRNYRRRCISRDLMFHITLVHERIG